MRSVRLDKKLEAKLARAARALGMSQADFLRHALVRRCDEVLGGSLRERLARVSGIVTSSGGRATHSGAAFRAVLARRRKGWSGPMPGR
jgi:hypothetical protein